MKRVLRWILLISAGFLLLVLAGVLLVQSLFSGFLQNYVSDTLGWSLKIGAAEIQFRPLSIRLENIELSAPDRKPFFRAKSASADFPYSSLWKDEFLVQQVTLISPAFDLEQLPERAGYGKRGSTGKTFRIENAVVREGEIQAENHRFTGTNISLNVDSQGAEIQGLSSKFNDIRLKLNGSLKNWENPEINLSYETQGDTAGLVSVFPPIKDWPGIVETRGTIRGGLTQPLISGELKSQNLRHHDSAPFAIGAKYQYDFKNRASPISLELEFGSVPFEIVRYYWKDVPALASLGSGSLEYSGGTDFWKGEGKFDVVLEAQKASRLAASGDIAGRLQNGIVQIDRSNLLLANSQLRSTGSLFRNGLDITTDFRTSNPGDVAFLHPKLASIRGKYDVQAHLSGPYSNVEVRAQLIGRSGESTLEAKGATSTGSKNVSMDFRGTAYAETLRAFVPEITRGEVAFEGSIQGTWKKPVITATYSGTNLQISSVQLDSLSGQVETSGNQLQFRATAPQLQFQTDGYYSWTDGAYEVRGIADGTPLELLLAFYGEADAPVRGNIHANFTASGNGRRWKDSTATLQLQQTDIYWKEYLISIPEGEIRVEERVATVKASVNSANARLNLAGTASLSTDIPLDLQLDGNISGQMLQKLSSDWKGEGDVFFDARVRGTSEKPEIDGELRAENFNANFIPKTWSLFLQQASARFSRQKLTLQGNGKFNDSPVQWSGSIPLERTDGNLHFEISELPVQTFASAANVSGKLNVVGDLQGKGHSLSEWKSKTRETAFQDWSGSVSITPSDLKVGERSLTVEQPIVVSIQKQELQLSTARVRSGELLDFEASGSMNLSSGELDSKMLLQANLDLLSNLKADIQSSGPLAMELRTTGTLKNPVYEGSIQLTRASLRIPDSPLSLEEVDLKASLQNNKLRVDTLQARSGGGVITGGGELIFGGKGSNIWVQGKNVAANYPEGLRSQVDFDLKLSSMESDVLLSGDVQILRSIYEEELNLRNPIIRKLLAATSELTTEKQLKNRLKLDVNIQTIQDLRFKNNLAILRGGADLKLEGSLYKPRWTGRLNIRNGGRIFLMGNQYDVEKATMEFFGSEFVEPNLDVTLSTLLRDFQSDTYYEVFLPFGGPPSNIEFKNVRSIPSLSQDQVFSLVTQGTVETEQIGSSRSIFQRQILAFFAGQALGTPTAALAKSIGLSRIQVQQEGLSSVNDPKTRLMLGKDIGSGFTLIYSFVLNDPEEQTWIASYRYGRNIIGRFIDQDDSTYTVSVSHRVPFGKGVSQSSFESIKKERAPRVASVEWKNESALSEKRIQDILKIEPGDEYDYWDLQDRVEDLKKEFQKMEYLFPVVDVREVVAENNQVQLKIEIPAAERAEMVFTGYDIGKKLLNKYMQMWRTGISAVVVQQMIQEDLLHQIQLTGSYKASVRSRVEKTDARTKYYFEAEPGPRYSTVELQFQGTEHYDAQVLQKDLSRLYPSSAILFREAIHDASDFSEKIKMLYVQQGYLRTEVEATGVLYSESGTITRTVRVVEGPVSQIDAVQTADGKSIPEDLKTQIQLTEGKTFLPDALLEDENKIRDYYEVQGYQDIVVRSNVEFVAGSSNLLMRWDVNTGPIARIAAIRVEGNQTTRTDLIREQAGFQEGDVLTQHGRSLARKRISDLGVFQQVVLEAEKSEDPGFYDVVIRVVENKKYEFQYGGRYNTDDKFSAEIRLTDFNFLGRAQLVSLYVRSTLDLPLFRVDYTLPVTGSFWDRTRFSIFRDETDEDVRATIAGDLVKFPFLKKQLTFQFQQDHRLWTYYRLLWGFEYGAVSIDFEDFETQLPVQFKGTEALFRGAFLADRRDDVLNATSGYFYSVDGEFAPTILGSDISYAKNFSQLFYYKKFGKVVLASGIRAGFLKIRSNILTVGEKFRTGGSASLRGFEHNTVVPGDDVISIFFGGDSVFIWNEEIRFPIYKWLSGATFFDAGNVYLRASDFDPADLRYSAGFGVRAGSGGFLLRFDFGFNLDRKDEESGFVFHFGIGQAF